MQIFLKSLDGRIHTLEVEGSSTYEDIVNMLTAMDIGLLTTNPKITIENRELEPGMNCANINVRNESEGYVYDPRPFPEHAIPRTHGEWLDDLPLSSARIYENIRFQDELKNKNEAIRERDEAIRERDEAVRQLRQHIAEIKTRDFQGEVTASRKGEYKAAQSRRRQNSDLDLRGGYRKRSKTIKRKGRRRKSSRK